MFICINYEFSAPFSEQRYSELGAPQFLESNFFPTMYKCIYVSMYQCLNVSIMNFPLNLGGSRASMYGSVEFQGGKIIVFSSVSAASTTSVSDTNQSWVHLLYLKAEIEEKN